MLIDLYDIKSKFIIHFVYYIYFIHKYNFRIYFKFNMLRYSLITIYIYYIFNNLYVQYKQKIFHFHQYFL